MAYDLERLNSLWIHLLGERPTGGGLREIHVTDADHPYGGVWWPPGHSIGWEASLVHELGHFLGAVAARRVRRAARGDVRGRLPLRGRV